MSDVLTIFGRAPANIEAIIPKAGRASKTRPARHDRLYIDHTRSICSTGTHRKTLYQLDDQELTSNDGIHWLREYVTGDILVQQGNLRFG